MDYHRLAELLFPDIKLTPADCELLYPQRQLPKGAMVTRIGPSPTGFIHLGNLYNAIIGERLAHQSAGVFFLRIEDTDAKREVPGAVDTILSSMQFFGIEFDEGATGSGDNGNYQPYRQRQRKNIYQAIAKHLVQKGLAYPCFCSEESLNQMRETQQKQKLDFGYYGKWATCRNLSLEQIEAYLTENKSFVLRFRSAGNAKNSETVFDGIRGNLSVQQNYQDFILLKSDGIPTYHFAHVVDDHLMRTTHVVRGEEWLASLPMHIETFDALGWERPVYCHTAQLMKQDGESRRKLSKRQDPELALDYYRAEGYLPAVVWEYLLTVLNSNYEEWRLANPQKDLDSFPFSLEKMSTSGALFDIVKLNDISKEILIKMPAEQIYDELVSWAQTYNKPFAAVLNANPAYAIKAISIGRSGDRPRKDIYCHRQAAEFFSFYYDELFQIEDELPQNVNETTEKEILQRYLQDFDIKDSQEQWFAKIRVLTEELGYAPQPKLYKKNPEAYRGSIVDVSNTIRRAITGRLNSPDLWEICQILGNERVRKRVLLKINK